MVGGATCVGGGLERLCTSSPWAHAARPGVGVIVRTGLARRLLGSNITHSPVERASPPPQRVGSYRTRTASAPAPAPSNRYHPCRLLSALSLVLPQICLASRTGPARRRAERHAAAVAPPLVAAAVAVPGPPPRRHRPRPAARSAGNRPAEAGPATALSAWACSASLLPPSPLPSPSPLPPPLPSHRPSPPLSPLP